MYIYIYMHLGSKALWKAYQALLVPQAWAKRTKALDMPCSIGIHDAQLMAS